MHVIVIKSLLCIYRTLNKYLYQVFKCSNYSVVFQIIPYHFISIEFHHILTIRYSWPVTKIDNVRRQNTLNVLFIVCSRFGVCWISSMWCNSWWIQNCWNNQWSSSRCSKLDVIQEYSVLFIQRYSICKATYWWFTVEGEYIMLCLKLIFGLLLYSFCTGLVYRNKYISENLQFSMIFLI